MTAVPTEPPRRNHLAWFGALLSVAALISYFAFFARFPFLRDTAWLNLLGVAVGLGLSLWAFSRKRSLWSAAGLVLSMACATALIGYVHFLSNQLPDAGLALSVGEVAPAFELLDQHGETVRLADFAGSSVALVFYRGFW
jgi:hypothetical protein